MAKLIAILALFGSALLARADFQGSTHLVPFDEDTIAYSKQQDDGAVARLQKKIDCGEISLKHNERNGYLSSILEFLKVPEASQVLVFSKTSFQRERISPETPRALFFNDNVYVGYIPNSPMLEFSAVDPKLGAVFYTLDQKNAGKPKFVRNDQCLECHASSKSMGVPGQLLRSFMTDTSGSVDLNSGTSQVNHRTPFEERWGGWYVTGSHGKQVHRGNLIGKAEFDKEVTHPNHKGNLTNLTALVDLESYPKNQSDIVALMVLEHQTHMHNFITRLNYEATIALKQFGHINYLKSQTEGFLKYMLFTEEAKFAASIQGDTTYQRAFIAAGPKDKQGRSLRDFDLKTRLFKYPCSFLVYSEAFDALPGPMKEKVYRRLYDILTGTDKSADYSLIAPETKKAILEILIATKTGLPEYWKTNLL